MSRTTSDWLKTAAAKDPKNKFLIETAFQKKVAAKMDGKGVVTVTRSNGSKSTTDNRYRAALSVIAEENPVSFLTQMNFAPRKTTDEEKLNKTEAARLGYLRSLNVPQLRIQAITVKLANDCRFTPDFSYVDENGRMTFEDVKGFQREDALIKIKMAAREFNEFRFLIVKKDKSGWDVQEVKP